MIIYFGKIAWGWKMYGIGYKTKWFLGFSINISKANQETKNGSL